MNIQRRKNGIIINGALSVRVLSAMRLVHWFIRPVRRSRDLFARGVFVFVQQESLGQISNGTKHGLLSVFFRHETRYFRATLELLGYLFKTIAEV